MPVAPSIRGRWSGAVHTVTDWSGGYITMSLPLTVGPIETGHTILVLVDCPNGPVAIADWRNNPYVNLGVFGSSPYGLQLYAVPRCVGLPAGAAITITAPQTYNPPGAVLGLSAVVLDVQSLDPTALLDGLQYATAPAADSGTVLDLAVPAVAVHSANILLIAAFAWAALEDNQAVQGAPPAGAFALDPAGGYADPGERVASVTSVRYVIDPITVRQVYVTTQLTLGVATRSVQPAAGSYAATLQWAGGIVEPAVPARELVLIALTGQPNQAPRAPSLVSRPNFDAAAEARFAWIFSDPDPADTPAGYQLIITRADTHAVVFDSGHVIAGQQYHDLAAGTITNGQSYQWQVRTWDQDGLVGPYSTLAAFTTAAAPIVVITNPTPDGVTVSQLPISLRWSFSGAGPQTAYQIDVLEGMTQIASTGKVASTALAADVTATTFDATAYTITLRSWDQNDVASAPVSRLVVTAFTPPPAPALTAAPATDQSHVALAWTTAAASPPATAAVSSADLYRRPAGTLDWQLLAAGLPGSGSYADYSAPARRAQEYQLIARAITTGTAASAIATARLLWELGIWLHALSDPAGSAHFFQWDRGQRSGSIKPAVALVQYDGRPQPVAQFAAVGSAEEVRCDLILPWDLGGQLSSDQVALEALVRRAETLCYRDHRSRTVYGVLPDGIDFNDESMAYTTTLRLVRTAVTAADIPLIAAPTQTGLRPTAGEQFATTTAAPLNSSAQARRVQLQVDPAAAAAVAVGYAGTQPIILQPGEEETLPCERIRDVYIRSQAGTVRVGWLAE